MGKPFAPSDVVETVPPLVDTFGRCEAECAAGMIVLTCKMNGDKWQAVTPKQIGEALQGASELWQKLQRNPFLRPDVFDLAERGGAEWVGNQPGRSPVRLTDAGLLAIGTQWVWGPARDRAEALALHLQGACGLAFDAGRELEGARGLLAEYRERLR